MMKIMKLKKAERGVSFTEYAIVCTCVWATLWAVYASWDIWGLGADYNAMGGQGKATLAENLEITDELALANDGADGGDDDGGDAPPPADPPPPPPPADPSLTNDGGTFTVNDATEQTRISVRYMGANAGLASVSSLWMRVRGSDGSITDVQLTANNTGAARDVVTDYALQSGDEISFFERIKPKSWSTNYYNFQNSRGRLNNNGTSTSTDDYYDVFSSASTGPNNVTQVTQYSADDAGNYWGTDEFHIGFEDLALDYGGCDRDYNDAEIRISIFNI